MTYCNYAPHEVQMHILHVLVGDDGLWVYKECDSQLAAKLTSTTEQVVEGENSRLYVTVALIVINTQW